MIQCSPVVSMFCFNNYRVRKGVKKMKNKRESNQQAPVQKNPVQKVRRTEAALTGFDLGTVLATARRSIRLYFAFLHGVGGRDAVDLSSQSDLDLAMVNEMMGEMYGSYDVMNVGNAVLFIQEEIMWRKEGRFIIPLLHKLLDADDFEGTASELLSKLPSQSGQEIPTGWPVSAKELKDRLYSFAQRLRTVGIHVSFERGTGPHRVIRIRRQPDELADDRGLFELGENSITEQGHALLSMTKAASC